MLGSSARRFLASPAVPFNRCTRDSGINRRPADFASRAFNTYLTASSRLPNFQPGPVDGVPGIEPRELGGGIDEGIGRGRARPHFLSRVP